MLTTLGAKVMDAKAGCTKPQNGFCPNALLTPWRTGHPSLSNVLALIKSLRVSMRSTC